MARVRGDRGDWQPHGSYSGQGPKPPVSQLLKGAGRRRPLQQTAERSGKVTIEKYRSLGLLFSSKSRNRRRLHLLRCLQIEKSSRRETTRSQIEQGQKTGLLLCYGDVYVDDVAGCASDLFMLGPGKQHPPRKGFFLRGGVVRRQGRSCFVLPSLPLLAQVASQGAPGGTGPCQP